MAFRNLCGNDCDGEDCAGSGEYFDAAPSLLNFCDGAETDFSVLGGKDCGGDVCGGLDVAGTNVQASACNLLAPSSLDVRDDVGEDGSAYGGAASGKYCGGDACGGAAASSRWTPRAGTNVQALARSLLALSALDVP